MYKSMNTTPEKQSTAFNTSVSLASGVVAGVVAAIISHPADTLLSKINKAGAGGSGSTTARLMNIAKELGFWRLATTGLGARCVMIGTLTAGVRSTVCSLPRCGTRCCAAPRGRRALPVCLVFCCVDLAHLVPLPSPRLRPLASACSNSASSTPSWRPSAPRSSTSTPPPPTKRRRRDCLLCRRCGGTCGARRVLPFQGLPLRHCRFDCRHSPRPPASAAFEVSNRLVGPPSFLASALSSRFFSIPPSSSDSFLPHTRLRIRQFTTGGPLCRQCAGLECACHTGC